MGNISIYFYSGWLLYNLIWAILMSLAARRVKKDQTHLFIGCFFFLFIILAICGSPISPDYQQYVDIIKDVASTRDPFTHIESFYIWLIHIIGNNFLLYQVCVYIPLFTILYLLTTIGWEIENPIIYLLLFSIICLYSAIVGRVFLFIVVYLAGITLIVRKKYTLGIILLISSFLFHKLSYIGLLISPLFFFPFNYNKRFLIIVAISLIVMILASRSILDYYFNELYAGLGELPGKDYLLKTEWVNEGGSLWWRIIYLYQVTFKYVISISALYYLKPYLKKLSPTARTMYILLFWVSIISLYLYCIGLPDTTIAGRTQYISIIPLCYVVSIIPNFRPIPKGIKISFFLGCVIYILLNNAYIVGVSHIIL